MRIVLKQIFPLGRFHATPWRVNPFDDAHGEWPPSPWRLVRAVVARWYQWARESDEEQPIQELGALVNALCTSRYAFRLPPTASRGIPLRQYLPTEFAWDPGQKKKAGMRTYKKSLAQDNYWCTIPNENGAVWWFLDGDQWNEDLLEVLDRCLERMTYFGRAEAFTRIERVTENHPEPNCKLLDRPCSELVAVLVPAKVATRDDIERTTGDRRARRSVPDGARYLYAIRPPRPTVHEKPELHALREPRCLVQLALGWNVAPELRAVARLTSRFRGAVLRELLHIKTKGACSTWSHAPHDVRKQVAVLAGKDAEGRPLRGHRHAEFFAWCKDGVPTRLLVWRASSPFDEEEERAILAAATRELSWAVPGGDADAWKVRLIPLDRAVPPPLGFDGASSRLWESLTPYVPPRHHLRAGKPRERESIEAQVRRELEARGYTTADNLDKVEVGKAVWVAVHVTRRDAARRVFFGDRRGYQLRLVFKEPVRGPLRLGHSSSFGVGLFRPDGSSAQATFGDE